MARSPPTCLSSEGHGYDIGDHLSHYLGCLDYYERSHFFEKENGIWMNEVEHFKSLKYTQKQAQELSDRKRDQWEQDCDNELRRINFLRETLKKDKEDDHLVKSIEGSVSAWRHSEEYTKNISGVQKWRDNKGLKNGRAPERELGAMVDKGEYDPEKDISAPVIQFIAGKPKTIEGGDVFGSFPDQKIKVNNLLVEGKNNILHKDHFHEGEITYFHLPSNNMAWAEEAIARYFGQSRPDFHAVNRKLQKQDKTETALLLKESHWRGQLHGEKTAANSRFMRPFCEAISSTPDKVEHNPKSVVLFMPFLHWETSRQRERFAQEISHLIYNEKEKSKELELKAKKERQADRRSLTKCNTKKPNKSDPDPRFLRLKELISRAFKAKKDQQQAVMSSPNSEEPETDGTAGPQRYSLGQRHLRATGRTLTLETAVQLLNRIGSFLEMDQNRRIKVKHPLGQYLIDAARLFEGMTSYRDKKLLEKFLCHDPPLHPRRTLDQAYYWTLDTSRTRDKDQVIYRATTTPFGKFHSFSPDKGWEGHDNVKEEEGCRECRENIRKVSRVVMVDQLWMWILDKQTIVTCFPKRYGANKNDISGVHKSIRLRVGQGRPEQVKSVFDLALIILDECSNTFFDRTRDSHDGYHRTTHSKQPQVLEAFSEAIGNISYKQTVAFGRLWRWTERARKVYRSSLYGNSSELQVPLLDINPEGELEKEIKDIVEELGIMIYVQKTHRDVLKQFITNVEHILDPTGCQGLRYSRGLNTNHGHIHRCPSSGDVASNSSSQTACQDQNTDACDTYDWFKINAEELTAKVNDRIEQLEELQRSAQNTADGVKDLLELKQQQASVVQAWQSVRQSEETIKQGRSIMMFTVVTIIFLPLSFMSSIFGMNVFEEEDAKTSLKEAFKWIFSISFSFLAVTLLVSLSTWVRAIIWHYYTRLVTEACVRTGIYGWSLNMDMPSRKLYENAIEITTKLKDKAKEETLKKRIEKRKANEEKKEKKTENANTDDDDAHGKARSRGESQGANSGIRMRILNRANDGNHPGLAEQGEGGLRV